MFFKLSSIREQYAKTSFLTIVMIKYHFSAMVSAAVKTDHNVMIASIIKNSSFLSTHDAQSWQYLLNLLIKAFTAVTSADEQSELFFAIN